MERYHRPGTKGRDILVSQLGSNCVRRPDEVSSLLDVDDKYILTLALNLVG